MYNAKYLIPAMIVFIALMLFPFFYGVGKPTYEVKVELPKDQKECIESKEVMRERHMQILDEWRNAVVRDNVRIYTNAKGVKYSMSLTDTCMTCHAEKDKFCDRCHNDVGVSPYCWDCHNISPEQKTPIPPAVEAPAEGGGH
jgi:hypothetical protein